jgi:RNA polymerase sigma factor (sigma-70 family)
VTPGRRLDVTLVIAQPRRFPPKKGGPRPLDDDRRGMALGAMKYAYLLANRYHHIDAVRLEELISEALGTLVEAAGRFDPDRGPPFLPYAGMLIRQRLVRTNQKGVKAGVPETIETFPPADFREIKPDKAAAAREVVSRLKQELPAKEFSLLWERYVEGRTLAAIAGEQGISRQGVLNNVLTARKHARNLFPELVQQYEP